MKYDVIVVGARAAGASTAMLLARSGARVLLLDRARRGSDTVSTHALMRAGVLQLSRWGLLDRIVAAGTPAIASTTFRYPREDPVTVAIRPSPGVDALYAPRRTVLDAILVEAAAEAGVEVRHETAVTGLRHDRFGRVDGVLTPRGELRARFVVGADGLRSVVADRAGAAVVAAGRHGSAIRYTYLEVEVAGTEWLYGDGLAGGIIPTNDGVACVFVSSTPERLRRRWSGAAERGWRAALAELVPDHPVLGARRIDRFHGWNGVAGFLREATGPGWVLVGDAGFFKDPMSTHGITDALRDAELAADALLSALGGAADSGDSAGSGSSGGGMRGEAALTAYARQRDALARPMLEVSDAIAAYHWRGSGVVPLVKRLSAAMTDEVALLEGMPAAVAPVAAPAAPAPALAPAPAPAPAKVSR